MISPGTLRGKPLQAFFLLFSVFFSKAQLGPERVKLDTINLGFSAISTNTIEARGFRFPYTLLDVKYDSISEMVFVSGKQGADQAEQGIAKGFFAGIDRQNQVTWLNESSLSAIDLSCNMLLMSNESRSHRFNKVAGYEELKYPGRLLYTWIPYSLGFYYENEDRTTLVAVDLRSGIIRWKAAVPVHEDWVDVKPLGDSLLLVAAAGLHALHPIKGLLWSKPFSTSVSTTKAMVYSLAKYQHIRSLSTFVSTSDDLNRAGQIASNIFLEDGRIIFAAKGRCAAFDHSGRELWRITLGNYPVSKMWLTRSDSALLLINFGLAMHSGRFVNWGKPFILEIYPEKGQIRHEHDLSRIENLSDFIKIKNKLLFAGKDEIMDTRHGEEEVKTTLGIEEALYGKFEEFIDGNVYYVFKEGYYVPLNFINDNLVYFRTDHNKIFGLDQGKISYEYHFTELYRYQGSFNGMTLLSNPKKTICTSQNYELMFELNSADPLIIAGDRLLFYGNNMLLVLNAKALR